MAVPVAPSGRAKAEGELEDHQDAAEEEDLVAELKLALVGGVPPRSRRVAVVLQALDRGGRQQLQLGWSDSEAMPYSAAALNSGTARVRASLEEVLVAHGGLARPDACALLSPAWLAALHIERLGSAVLLLEDNHPFRGEPWASIPSDRLWTALLAAFPGARRLARLARIRSGPKRQSQVQLLFPAADPAVLEKEGGGPGSPGWVTVRENGLNYSFDMTHVMFSSGNVSEKARWVGLRPE